MNDISHLHFSVHAKSLHLPQSPYSKMAPSIEYNCYIGGCYVSKTATAAGFHDDVSQLGLHFRAGSHRRQEFDFRKACQHNDSKLGQLVALSKPNMEAHEFSSAGRPQREKKPSEKAKDSAKPPLHTDDNPSVLPPKYVMPGVDPKWSQEPREIAKIYDHTKLNKTTGERTDFYKLGNQ